MKGLPWVIIAVVVGGGLVWVLVQSRSIQTNINTHTNISNNVGDRTEPDGTVVKADGTKVSPDGTMVKPDGTMVKPDGTVVKPDGTMIGPDGTEIKESNTNISASNTNSSATTSQAKYTNYSAAALAVAEAKGRTIIYFHAPWCPICVVLEPQLLAQIGTLPSDITILKADYDSSTDLKKKYGVTYQHTFVQVDQQGNKIKLWSGGDVQTIKDNLVPA